MKALVLSVGGSKGAFQLGVLKHLLDKDPNLDYDIYSGISVGALNASFLAMGSLKETLPKLEQIWFKDIKDNKSIWKHHLWWYILFGICLIIFLVIIVFLSLILHVYKAITIGLFLLTICSFYIPFFSLKNSKSIYKTNPLRSIISKNLDVNKLRTSGKILRVGAVCFETGEYKTGKESDYNIIDWIMASSAFPIFFPTVKIEGKNWLDGGIINIADINSAVSSGATEIDVILCNPIDQSTVKKNGLLNQFERVLDLMSAEIFSNDITNYRSKVNIRIFMPEKNFNVSSLDFNSDKIKMMFESGQAIAKKTLNV
jgi:NTE family protein